MLPFVLGRVALAATGYGVKKYFEHDDIYESDTALDDINKIKEELHNTLFQETGWLYRSIKNLQSTPRLHADDIKGKPDILDTTENNEKLNEFCQILTLAQESQYKLLGELESVFCGVDDMEQLSDEDIEKAVQMRELDNAMHEACQVALTLDGISISKMANITFRKLNMLTNTRE